MVLIRWVLFFLMAITPIGAMQLSMGSTELDIRKTSHLISSISNPGKKPIAVNISVADRIQDINGTESTHRESDDFIIFPPQFILQPDQEQAVTLKWVGDLQITQEKAYRIIVENVPYDDFVSTWGEDTHSGTISFRYRIVKGIYTTNKNYMADIQVNTISKQGKTKLIVILDNKGKKHQIIRFLKLKLTQNAYSRTFSLNAHQLNDGGINILANSQHRIVLPYPQDFHPQDPIIGEIIQLSEFNES